MKKVAAVDFETTYDKECSIRPLGWDAYFRHEHFEAYLVAIKTNDGIEWVGHPKEAPWDSIKDHLWVSHNASFDENLYRVAKELGWWGDIPLPKLWHCTSDLVAYLGYPRSLKDSCKAIFNADLSKEVRTNMASLRPPDSFTCVNEAAKSYWKPMTPEFWQDVLDYALDDSVWCLKLWETCSDNWPENERWLSDHTREIARRGIPVDIDYIIECEQKLIKTIADLESDIPWRDSDALLSRSAFDRECLKNDLRPPKSLDQNNAEAVDWFELYEPKHKWIFAYRNWRRANSLLSRVRAFLNASRKVGDHYRFFGGLMYCGAHTKRWSGSGGNTSLHNMSKGEMFGVEIRKFFRASEGKVFIAIDLSQIEVRTLTWLARDKEMLDKIKNSPDIYQAFAERFKLWSASRGSMKALDPDLRQSTKPIVLGSGFGASAFSFANKEKAQLLTSLRAQYKEEDFPALGRAYLQSKIDSKEGAWWWRKMGRFLSRSSFKPTTKTTSSGKEYVVDVPAWKVWDIKYRDLNKKLVAGATVPVDLDGWEWSWEDVLIYAESEKCVGLYRDTMQPVTSFWKMLKGKISGSVLDRSMKFTFPSGNSMYYRNVRKGSVTDDDGNKTSQIFCTRPSHRGWAAMKLWHGLVTENLAQSLARDIFAYMIRRLEEDISFPVLFHVHDEVVGEVDESIAEEMLAKGVKIMQTPPPWIPEIPVDGEGAIGPTYSDCK